MVVVGGGNVLHNGKGRGNCPGEDMSGGICPRGECPDPVVSSDSVK